MKFRILGLFAILIFIAGVFNASAQELNTVLGQITDSTFDSFAGGISGDGRFVVIESRGDIATENPRNADGNREIFLFDYAQRRIFQITDTKSELADTTVSATLFSNIKVEILSIHPVISKDGRWIAFASNATTSTPTAPNSTNPGSFDGNTTGYPAILEADGNTEIWLYQIPATGGADLSSGAEVPLTNLSAGSFTRVTNSAASATPIAATTTSLGFIAEDNHDASISNDGSVTAFASTRSLISGGNTEGNDEIFTYVRSTATTGQVTKTPRGTVSKPIFNDKPTISGDGTRVMFASTGDNPVDGMSGGSNADRDEEVFYANLNTSTGAPTGTATARGKQVTTTTQTNAGDIVNIINLGTRMSNDGRYIAFDSFADLASENGGANYTTSFALYLYDTTTSTFRRVGPRSDADSGATSGDIPHYPGFTFDDNSQPLLVYQSRLNIKPDGTIPATASDGLNPDSARPTQIYFYPLSVAPAAATFTKITKIPTPTVTVTSVQPLTSNNFRRIAFNFAYTEVGTGNPDLLSEAYYLLAPAVTTTAPDTTVSNFLTGASRRIVSPSPVPTPTITPTPSPTPTVTPTPVTPNAVQGLAPGMLAAVNFTPVLSQAATARTAVGSVSRRFTLPIQLSGVTVTFNGIAAGIKSVTTNEVTFVVPPALPAADADTGTSYTVLVNYNGTVIKSTATLVPARPDVFTKSAVPGPGGRAQAFNATNRVPTPEPFTVTTYQLRGGKRVATVLRIYMTGVSVYFSAATVTARVGSVSLPSISPPVLVEPGIYAVDFNLTAAQNGAGDQPVVVSVTINGITYFARLDDTAPRISIL